jgi:hypothetical protein
MTCFDEQPDGDTHGECAAEIERLNAQIAMLHKLLSTSFSAFENGAPCYEDEDDPLYIGNAVKFDDETFHQICDALTSIDSASSDWLAKHDQEMRDKAMDEVVFKALNLALSERQRGVIRAMKGER